jgi:hypothetical protein
MTSQATDGERAVQGSCLGSSRTTRERVVAALGDQRDHLRLIGPEVRHSVSSPALATTASWTWPTDRRDFRHEAAEELLDGIAYAAMDALRGRRSNSVVERARQAAAELKAACGAAVVAEEREAIARLLADLAGDTGTSLTERALGEVLDSGRGGR